MVHSVFFIMFILLFTLSDTNNTDTTAKVNVLLVYLYSIVQQLRMIAASATRQH